MLVAHTPTKARPRTLAGAVPSVLRSDLTAACSAAARQPEERLHLELGATALATS
jgi:hypothetical protein